ncbi:MAG TPA: redoxin domain-containing protein, partial [Acidimicrobiales bacterium]|nr:redoxin domain-containing protein [Acidimicrobiales bacterium]
GVGLVAVSPQAPDASLSTAEKNELTFTVLSDPGNQLASVAGVLTTPSDHARAAQVQLGLDLSKVNADGNVTLPMATAVVVDGSGVVQWDDVHPDYTTRSEPDEILTALDPLGIR